LDLLLNAGCKLDSQNKDHHMPLHLAILNRHVDAVKLLLNHSGTHKYDEADKNGNRALHLAAMWGHFDTTQLLLVKGCDIAKKKP